ncbi:wax ester/triacylglycerol synthase domain-containing protein [Streptomyces sp. 135]|nr:wax ester/triacylglycerol synthase domain-containing protein [Streptomyces sp. 135]
MSPKDQLMWRLEKDPRVYPVIVLLVLLDGPVDLPALYAWHRQAARLVPRMAAKVITPRNPFAAPYWVPDELSAPERHIRQHTLDGKGTEDDLFQLIESVAPLPFVPHRPPWDAYLIDGLQGGRTAYLLKISHTIVDGMRLRDMFLRHPLSDMTSRTTASAAATTPVTGLAQVRRTRRSSRLGRWGTRCLLAAEIIRQVADSPRLPRGHGDGVGRRYWGMEVSVTALRAAAGAGGGNEQDALVAAIADGCHRYHQHIGVDRPRLYTLAPYARAPLTRQNPDPVGNHWFVIRMGLPAAGSWTDRVRAARNGAIRAYNPNSWDWFGAGAQAIRPIPGSWFPVVFHRFCATFDFLTTSIPGPKRTAVLAGVAVSKVYGVAPTMGCGVTVAMVTHAGRCHLTLTIDPSVIRDPDQMARCIRKSVLDAVEATTAEAGKSTQAPSPLRCQVQPAEAGTDGHGQTDEHPNTD